MQRKYVKVDEALEWFSPYLRLFLQNLVKSDIKQVAVGLAITLSFPLFSWELELMLIACLDCYG